MKEKQTFKTDRQWGEYLRNEASDKGFAEVQSGINKHYGIFSAKDRKWINQIAENRKGK